MNTSILQVALWALTGMVRGQIQKGTDEKKVIELPMPAYESIVGSGLNPATHHF